LAIQNTQIDKNLNRKPAERTTFRRQHYFRFTRGASYHHSVDLNYEKWCHGPPKNRLWPTSGPWLIGWEPPV